MLKKLKFRNCSQLFLLQFFLVAQGSHPRPLWLQWWEGPKSRPSSDGNSEQMWLFRPKNVFLVGFPAALSWYSAPCGLHVVICFGFSFFFFSKEHSFLRVNDDDKSEWMTLGVNYMEKTLSYSKSDSAVQLERLQRKKVHSRTPWMNFLTRFNHLNMFKNKVQHIVASPKSTSGNNPVSWIQTALSHETNMVNAFPPIQSLK